MFLHFFLVRTKLEAFQKVVFFGNKAGKCVIFAGVSPLFAFGINSCFWFYYQLETGLNTEMEYRSDTIQVSCHL